MQIKISSVYKKLVTAVIALLMTSIFCLTAFAEEANQNTGYIPYQTYIYDYNGNPVITPHAYVPKVSMDGEKIGIDSLKNPSDMITTADNEIIIADTGNNRILILNSSFKVNKVLKDFTGSSINTFNNPGGIFISEKKELYVADTGNARILQFDMNLNYVREIGKPVTNLLPDGYTYAPRSLAVDKGGHIYVVADGVNMGIIHFNPDGKFSGFYGAQKVAYNPVDYLWKNILSKEQQDRMVAFVPTEYNNITIDKKGFLYVTTSAIDKADLLAAINSRSKSSKGAPIKKINHAGNDVLKRNGYYPPAGDIKFKRDALGNMLFSIISDVALGTDGTYTILDTRYSRLFTYSANGDLLYAFGGKGRQFGNSQSPSAIAYFGDKLLLLDKDTGRITMFERTSYGNLLSKALGYSLSFEYEKAYVAWEDVLKENSNFDIAYDGIGESNMRLKDFKKAMEYYGYSNNKTAYSNALKEYRAQAAKKYWIILILIVVAMIWLLLQLGNFIGRRIHGEKYKYKREKISGSFFYGFYLLTHPIDGFWDLKHEKRGSIKSATIILILAVVAMVGQKILTSYLFNDNFNAEISIVKDMLTLLIPVGLWVVANWCVTSLMDGEGNIKDIYKFTGYSLLPIAIIYSAVVPVSYLLVMEEKMYISFFISVAIVWAGLLLLLGNMVTHQYTLTKNLASIGLTILGIGIILFIALLILTTYQKAWTFIENLFKEISYRI